MSRRSNLANLTLSLVAVSLVACSDPKGDFEAAAVVDTPEAYSGFLQQHPEGELARRANARVQLLTAWAEAQAGGPEALRSFAEAYPGDELASEALALRDDLILEEALGNLGSSAVDRIRPISASLARSRSLRDVPPELVDEAILLLRAHSAVTGESADWRLRPGPWAAAAELGELGAGTYRCAVELRDAAETSLDLTSLGWLTDPGSSLVLEAQGAMIELDALPSRSVAVVGSFELEGRDGGLTLRSAGESGRLLFATDWFGAVEPVLAGGVGSCFQVKGSVVGTHEDPLVWVVSGGGELEYVAGMGQLVSADGTSLRLPDERAKIVELSRPSSGGTSSARGLRIEVGSRELSTNRNGALVRRRCMDREPGFFPLVRFDLANSTTFDGVVYVRAQEGSESLASVVQGTDGDVLLREDGIWVSRESLACDDTWDRIWTATGGSAFLRVPPAQRILDRFSKDKDDAFTRDLSIDAWEPAERAGQEAESSGELAIHHDVDSGTFYYSGSLYMAAGTLKEPVHGLYTGLVDKDKAELMEWLTAAGVPSERAALACDEILAMRAELQAPGMTFGALVELAFDSAPTLAGILADPTSNYIQPLAEAVDRAAGDMVFGFGFGGASSPVLTFEQIGEVCTLEVPESTPYPFDPSLSLWEGAMRNVEDIDGQRLRWIEDGTRFRQSVLHGLVAGQEEAGEVSLLFEGRTLGGRPRGVSLIERRATYSLGPIAADSLTYELPLNQAAELELDAELSSLELVGGDPGGK
ncbi:MAG: hypothetical protein P1V81_10740 [Planctomycetota bacterium]|nr:hypothetical protein [Planctomycetota bacterium]